MPSTIPRTRRSTVLALALLVLTVLHVAGLPAPAATGAASAGETARGPIGPGVQMFTRGAQCTGNFVFADAAGRRYVGYAAHCAARGEATDVNGCRSTPLPLGTRVRFAEGATVATAGTTLGRGRLAYSSWRTMRRRGTRAQDICTGNDLALVRVVRRHRDRVDPTVPFWGGPTGLGDGAPAGTRVHSWGSSSLRPTTVLSPKTGMSLGPAEGGWVFDVYTATPGVPGDSGSGVLDAEGRAAGTLSTVSLAPLAGSNGVGNLARELAYARRWSGIEGLRLLPGREAFTPLP